MRNKVKKIILPKIDSSKPIKSLISKTIDLLTF